MISSDTSALVRALPEPVTLVSGTGEILACSRKAEAILCPDRQTLSNNLLDCLTAPASSVLSYLESCLRTRELLPSAFSIRGNSPLRCRFEGGRVGLPVGRSQAVVWLRLIPQEQANSRFLLLNERISQLSKEVLARARVESALRERTAQFETLLNEAPLGVYLLGPDLRIQQMNPTAAQFFGIPDAVGRGFDEIVYLLWPAQTAFEIVERFRQTLATGTPYLLAEFRELRQDRGSHDCYEWQVNRIPLPQGRFGLVCYFRDISARKLSEEALMKSEKLAATGRLASSIAHEINNPLEGVTNLLYLARHDPALTPETMRYLQTAEQELARVANIAKQTLGFYRGSSSPTWFSVPDAIDSVISMYEHRIKDRNVRIVRQYRHTPPVFALAGEFRQVLSNLLINALDAVSGQDAVLAVRVSPSRDWHNGAAPGIRISIADNGRGIPAATFSRIFEAFFTTKAATGTGLGLWLSQQIVQQHRGRIQVRSRTHPERSGTTFSILWPLQSQDDESGRT